MKLLETLHFSETHYQQTISHKYFSYAALAKEIYKKPADKLTSTVRGAMSIAAVPFTGGLSGLSYLPKHFRRIQKTYNARRRMGSPRTNDVATKEDHGTSLMTIGIDVGLSRVVDDLISGALTAFDLNGHLISEAFLQPTVADHRSRTRDGFE